MFRKLLLAFAIVSILLIFSVGIFLSGGPEFPQSTDSIIHEVIKKGPPDLLLGHTGYAQSGTDKSTGPKIWYETIKPSKSDFPKPRGTILLVMGAGASSMFWSPEWLQEMVHEGYQVIRFDNRATGLSDWVENWNEDQPYSVEDMAKDALTVLDANGVQQAHIVGVSMGGMIAQRLAISHAERVLSLVSVSTSAYIFDPAFAEDSAWFGLEMLRLVLKYTLTGSESGMTKMWLGLIDLMRSGSLQDEDVRDVANMVLYEMRKRRGYNQQAMTQHMAAMKISGSRLGEMEKIKCPVLVIHGTDDISVKIAHAMKYAPLIPVVQTLWLEGEGHLLRKSVMPRVTAAMFNFFKSVKG